MNTFHAIGATGSTSIVTVAPGIAEALVNIVDLTGHRLLVDIGGGPGAYSTYLLKRYPELCSRILDLPSILEVAGSTHRHSGPQTAG